MAGPHAPRAMEPIEIYLAKRLLAARLASGISQINAGAAVGVSFQQVQKYEKGTNRVSLGKLLKLADLYGTTLDKLLDGAPGRSKGRKVDQAANLMTDMISQPYGVDVAQAFVALDPDSGRRQVLRTVARALAGENAGA